MKKSFVFGIVFLLLISLVQAKSLQLNETFTKGDYYDISIDKAQYTSKSGVICYDLLKTKDNAGIIDKMTFKKINDSIKLTGLKSLYETKKVIEVKETQKICNYYSFPLGYVSKFNVEVGTDILDPLINITNPYNESCKVSPANDLVYAVSGSFDLQAVSDWTLRIDHTTTGKFTEPIFFSNLTLSGSMTDHPLGCDVRFVFYYENGSTAGTVEFGIGTLPASNNFINSYQISYPDKIASFDMYHNFWQSGEHANLDYIYFYKSCTPYFYDTYSFNTGFISSINLTANSQCTPKNISVSETGEISNYTTLSSYNFTFSEPVNTFYLKINQSSCTWVNINNTYANENLSNSINLNLYNSVTYSAINTNTMIELYNADHSIYESKNTTTGNHIFYFLNPENYTLKITNPQYTTSYYFMEVAEGDHDILNAYMIPANTTDTTNVKIVSSYGNNLDNVLVTAKEYIGGSLVTITQKYTDSTGIASLELDDGHTYTLYLHKSGFITQTATITPTYDPYDTTLIMSPDLALNYTSSLNCIDYYTYTSEFGIFEWNKTYNFTLSAQSSTGGINYFGILANNGTRNFSVNMTAFPSGSDVRITLNFTDWLNTTYFIKCSGQPEYSINITYTRDSYNYTNTSFTETISSKSADLSPFAKIMAIIITSLVLMVVMWELGLPPISYGLGICLVLIIFTIPPISFINPIVTIISCFIILAGMFWQGGQNG